MPLCSRRPDLLAWTNEAFYLSLFPHYGWFDGIEHDLEAQVILLCDMGQPWDWIYRMPSDERIRIFKYKLEVIRAHNGE